MARFEMIIHVEGIGVRAGDPLNPGSWLGRCLTVSLPTAPAGPLQGADLALATLLMSPWKWDGIEWDPGGYVASAPTANLSKPLDDYLARILAGDLKPLEFRVEVADPDNPSDITDVDDADEDGGPIWPGLLAQFARLGGEISRGLCLAHAVEDNGAQFPNPPIKSVKIGNTTYPVRDTDPGTSDVWIRCRYATPLVLPPGKTGLIDHVTRLVDKQAETADEDWLAELPHRLGRALDPVARAIDLVRLPGAAPVPAAWSLSALGRALEQSLAGAAEPTLRALLDALLPDEPIASKQDFAGKWAAALAQALPALKVRLLKHFGFEPGGPAPSGDADAARLAAVWSGPDLDPVVRDALAAAAALVLPANPDLLREVEAWLAKDGNVAAFWRGHLPSLLARSTLFPLLAASAAGGEDDLQRIRVDFREKLLDALTAVLGSLPRQGAELDPLVESAESLVFERDQAVDRGGKAGLRFKVDAVFLDKPQVDLHLDLDGYLVAIAPRKMDGAFGDFLPVTIGAARIASVEDSTSSQVPSLLIPQQVAFERTREGQEAVETRNAIAGYFGEAMIPWNDRPLPQGETGDPQQGGVRIGYSPLPGGEAVYPPLAYGQDYLVACGYQAQGGLLPVGFGDPQRPWLRSLDNGYLAPRAREMRFRRTQPPGAPELRMDDPVGGPLDDKVRPLWKEHLSRWGADQEALRRRLSDASTLYVDALAGSSARRKFEFQVRPPKLGLGRDVTDVTNAQVWDYWVRRDEQWGANPVARPKDSRIDDPAVVGKVRGNQAGRGGVRFTLWSIGRDGPGAALAPVDVALAENQKVQVVVEAAEAAVGTLLSFDLATLTLTVKAPPGTRFVLEAQTICDSSFFENGSDVRFLADTEGMAGERDGAVRLFGSRFLAIEALPESRHLPAPADLWNAMDVLEKPDGAIVASLLPPSAAPVWDHVGRVDVVWQTFDWDGGPVLAPPLFGLTYDLLEQGGANARDPNHVRFEQAMFVNRKVAGASQSVEHVAGARTHLFEIEARPNRGADYLRLNLLARSRYAALRARADPDGDGLRVASHLGGSDVARWRGRAVSLRRRDALPTPRLAAAAPVFSSIERNRIVGGVGLYLDGGAYSVREGGGLAERIVAEILVEPTPDGTGIRAVGRDPIFRTDVVANPALVAVACTVVLGQTLEPVSAAPQFPFTFALLELDAGAIAAGIGPDTMARVRLRLEADTATSDWSAPLWVHFLDETDSTVDDSNRIPVPAFEARRDNGEVVVKAGHVNAEPRMKRLLELAGDFRDATVEAPWLVRSVYGLFLTTVTGVDGAQELRTLSDLCRAKVANTTLRITPAGTRAPTHIRLVEVHHVQPGATLVERLGTDALFGAGAADVEARIASIGPLIPIAGT